MRRSSSSAPDVVTVAMMAFTTGAFYVAGGTAAALTTAPSWDGLSDRTVAVLVLAVVAVTAGVLLLRWGSHLPRWSFHVVVGGASTMVSAGVLLSEDGSASLAVAGLFVFCAVDILYFFHGRQAVAQTLVLLVATAGSLTLRGTPPALTGSFVLVQLAVIVVIGHLVARASQFSRDALTGLRDRRGFDDRLDRAAHAAHRKRTPLCVALIDVDHFKSVNDLQGHAAGDALLQHLVGAWSAVLPPDVHLSRQGGDEFALVAQHRTADELQLLCAQLHTLAAPTTISIGVAELRRGESGAPVVRRADGALYDAKAAGRSCTRVAGAGEEALGSALAAAVAGRRIEVVLHPVVRPASGEVVAVQAVASWDHPERGPVPASVFMPLAEGTGLARELSAIVLDEACRGVQQLQLEHEVVLMIGIDDRQLTAVGFVEDLAHVLEATGLPPGQLVLEVPQDVLGRMSTGATAALLRLRALGVSLGIDASGARRPALDVLHDLPVDHVRVEVALLQEMASSPRGAVVLRALHDLYHRLGVTLVAQGVDTAGAARSLADLGRPLAQGALYAPAAALGDAAPRMVPDARRVRSDPCGGPA